MASDYLLPCTCGRTHRISSRQAGSTIACACGANLEVPTMRELGRLEPAAAATAVRHRAWGLRQGLMFLGSMIVGGGIAAGCYFSLIAMPAASEGDVPQARLDELQPAQAWMVWTDYRRGIPRRTPPDIMNLVHQRDRAQRGVHVAWIAIAVGGVTAASGFLVRKTKFRPSAV